MNVTVTNGSSNYATIERTLDGEVFAVVLPNSSVTVDVPRYYDVAVRGADLTFFSETPFDANVDQRLYMLPSGPVVSLGAASEVPSSFVLPIVGSVTLPSWALLSPEAAVFFLGFAFACGVRLFRSGNRWFKRVGEDTNQ